MISSHWGRGVCFVTILKKWRSRSPEETGGKRYVCLLHKCQSFGNTETRKFYQAQAQGRRRSQKEAEGSTVEVSVWGVHLSGPEETNLFHPFIVWPVGAPTGFTRSYVPMDCIRKNFPGWATGKM